MTRLRHTSLLLVVLAALVATGTGAFTTVGAERPFEVGVADQEQALLGVQPYDITTDNPPTSHNLLTVDNNFDQRITVTVTVTPEDRTEHPKLKSLRPDGEGTHHTPDSLVSQFSLGPASSETVRATVSCNNATDKVDWDMTVSAEGDSVSVETADSITVSCTGRGGNQNPSDEADDSTGTGDD